MVSKHLIYWLPGPFGNLDSLSVRWWVLINNRYDNNNNRKKNKKKEQEEEVKERLKEDEMKERKKGKRSDFIFCWFWVINVWLRSLCTILPFGWVDFRWICVSQIRHCWFYDSDSILRSQDLHQNITNSLIIIEENYIQLMSCSSTWKFPDFLNMLFIFFCLFKKQLTNQQYQGSIYVWMFPFLWVE